MSLGYSDQVSVDLSEQTAALLFINSHRSNQNMLIQIVVREKSTGAVGDFATGVQSYGTGFA